MGFYFPIGINDGVQIDFDKLVNKWLTPETRRDYEDIISRYQAFPKYADQIITMMRTAVSKKLTNHKISMEGVVDKLEEHTSGFMNSSVFLKPFLTIQNQSQEAVEKLHETLSSDVIDKLMDSAKEAIHGVRGGMARLANFIKTEYLPACRIEIGISSLPQGKEFYQACIRFHTSYDWTPEEIHDIGIEEVANNERKIQEIIFEQKLNMTVKDFNTMMKDDESNYLSTSEIRDAFDATIDGKIGPQITNFFHTGVLGELEIKSDKEEKAAWYQAGTVYRPSVLYIATSDERSLPKYIITALSLHEANPGHHYQAMYMQNQSIPSFRKVLEDRIYSQAPSRFPTNTAYTEGWGLYSETLGTDFGLYDEWIDRYGQLTENLLRSCRLVVDTGMHALNWTREGAVRYMVEHTPMDEKSINSEVNRYITWPGQALGYKIGQRNITAMRNKAEKKLGLDFVLKDFHKVVLRASGPLWLLEKKVEEYIDSSLKEIGEANVDAKLGNLSNSTEI